MKIARVITVSGSIRAMYNIEDDGAAIISIFSKGINKNTINEKLVEDNRKCKNVFQLGQKLSVISLRFIFNSSNDIRDVVVI